MNKEQESKFEKWYSTSTLIESRRDVWKACCSANGINTEEPVQEQPFSDLTLGTPRTGRYKTYPAAPEWVIEMMRTGEAVECEVWDTLDTPRVEHKVIGFSLDDEQTYLAGGYWWKHAEPLPAWQPQDGEAVLFKDGTTAWAGIVSGGDIVSRGACVQLKCALDHDGVKPYKKGGNAKDWSEI